MPLSDDEVQLVYEVLAIPNQLSVINIDGEYGTGRKSVDYAITTAKSEIDARIASLSSAQTTRLQTYLAKWDTVNLREARIYPNGSNEGVDSKPGRLRALISKRIFSILGVIIADRQGSHADGSIALG